MGRLSASLLALLLAAAATVALTSCGGSDTSGLLPGSTASEINSNLDRVPELVAEGDCAGATEASGEIKEQIEALEGVDSRLKEALSEGASRLAEVVSTCEEAPDEAEELETLEEDELAEDEQRAEEKREQKEKPKPEKEKEQREEPVESKEPPGQEKKEEVIPPEEGSGESASGGVGPAAPAEGE